MAGGGRDLVIRQELLRRPAFDMEIDNNPEIDDSLSEMLHDHEELQKSLDDMQMYYFELQKKALQQPKRFASRKIGMNHKHANLLDNVNNVGERTKLENILSCHLRYAGIMIKACSSDMCVVMFDVNVVGVSRAQFAIYMSKSGESDSWILKKYHLPLGFSLKPIEKMYETMTPEYILEIQKALNAQYNRLWQIEQIKEMLPECAQLAHSSNANWVELLLKLKSQGDEEEVITIQCQFFYDTSKIRPSDFQISTLGICEGTNLSVLETQMKPFRLFRLQDAFRFSFQNQKNAFVCFTRQELIFYEKQKFIGSKDNNINNQCQWMNDSNDENFNHHEKNDNKKLEHRNYESKISNAKNTLYDRISSDSEFDECDSIMEVAPKNTKISSKKKNQDNTLNSSQEKPVKKIKKPIKKITNVSKGKKSKNNDSLNTTSEDGQPVRKPRGRPRGPNSKLNKKSEIENKKSN